MLQAVLKHWELIAGAGLMAVTAFIVSGYVVRHVDAKYEKKLLEQRTELNLECLDDQQLAYEVGNEIQDGIQDARNRLGSAMQQLRSPTAGKALKGSTSVGDATSAGGRLYYSNPEGARPALERAEIATEQAHQLIGCQKFIREERQVNPKK